jgi:hypothetical protein
MKKRECYYYVVENGKGGEEGVSLEGKGVGESWRGRSRGMVLFFGDIVVRKNKSFVSFFFKGQGYKGNLRWRICNRNSSNCHNLIKNICSYSKHSAIIFVDRILRKD